MFNFNLLYLKINLYYYQGVFLKKINNTHITLEKIGTYIQENNLLKKKTYN